MLHQREISTATLPAVSRMIMLALNQQYEYKLQTLHGIIKFCYKSKNFNFK